MISLAEKTIDIILKEPRKLEQLIIKFVKLSITLFISFLLFGHKISFKDIHDFNIENYSLPRVIVFLTISLAIWYIIWWLIAEEFFFPIILFLISIITKGLAIVILIIRGILWVFKFRSKAWRFLFDFFWKAKLTDKTAFLELLEFSQIISRKDNVMYPRKRIVAFSDFLNEFEEYKEEMLSLRNRLHQYVLLLTVSYVLIICVKEIGLPNWVFWAYTHVYVNLLIIFFFLDRFLDYISLNLYDLKREFQPLSYIQLVFNAGEKIRLLADRYNQPQKLNRFKLTLKQKWEHLPNEIDILIAYSPNKYLAEKMIVDELLKRKFKSKASGFINTYRVIITDIPPNDIVQSLVSNQRALIYIYANTEEEIRDRLEESIYEIQKVFSIIQKRRREKVKKFVEGGFLTEDDYKKVLIAPEIPEESFFLGGYISNKLAEKLGFDTVWVEEANNTLMSSHSSYINRNSETMMIADEEMMDWSTKEIIDLLIISSLLSEDNLC